MVRDIRVARGEVSSIYYVSEMVAAGRLKRPSRIVREEFSSLEEKYDRLRLMCKKNELLVGGPACELFNVGGTKNIVWMDIDCRIGPLVELWTNSERFPFKKGSFKIIRSSTGRFHMYAVTDRPLMMDECISMHEIIIRSTDEEKLIREIDRVYGPDHYMNVFFPHASTGDAKFPQEIVADLTEITVLPELQRVPYEEWSARKKLLRESILGKDPY